MFVYICHSIRGDKLSNLKKILKIVRAINLNMPDIVPLTNYFADCLALCDEVKEERDKGLYNDKKLIQSGIVDEIWVFGEQITEGMRIEIDIAKEMGIPVKYIREEVFLASVL